LGEAGVEFAWDLIHNLLTVRPSVRTIEWSVSRRNYFVRFKRFFEGGEILHSRNIDELLYWIKD